MPRIRPYKSVSRIARDYGISTINPEEPEELPSGRSRPVIAIEIKGGKDVSNVHNRVGEAEKSHQKAKKDGFTECWTILGITGLDHDLLRGESPTTDKFFALDEITRGDTEAFDDFKEQLYSRIGLRESP